MRRTRTDPTRQPTRVIVDLQAFQASPDIVCAPVIVNQTAPVTARFADPRKAFERGALPRIARLEFGRRFGNNRAAFRLAPQGRFAPRAARAALGPGGHRVHHNIALATAGRWCSVLGGVRGGV